MPPKKVRLGRPKKRTTDCVTVTEISDMETDSDLISPVISSVETESISEDIDLKKKTKNMFSVVKRLVVKNKRGVLQNKSNEKQLSPFVLKKSAKQQISASFKRKEPSSSDPECLSLKKMHISSRFVKQPVVKPSTILNSDSVSSNSTVLLPVNNKRRSQRIIASINKKGPQNSITVIEGKKTNDSFNAKNASLPQTPAVSTRYAATTVIFSF